MGGHKEEASKTYIHQQKTQLLVLQKKHRLARPKAGQLVFQEYEPCFVHRSIYSSKSGCRELHILEFHKLSSSLHLASQKMTTKLKSIDQKTELLVLMNKNAQ